MGTSAPRCIRYRYVVIRFGRCPTDGRGQAYDYANRIGARFAYCTNGLRTHEIDMHNYASQ